MRFFAREKGKCPQRSLSVKKDSQQHFLHRRTFPQRLLADLQVFHCLQKHYRSFMTYRRPVSLRQTIEVLYCIYKSCSYFITYKRPTDIDLLIIFLQKVYGSCPSMENQLRHPGPQKIYWGSWVPRRPIKFYWDHRDHCGFLGI